MIRFRVEYFSNYNGGSWVLLGAMDSEEEARAVLRERAANPLWRTARFRIVRVEETVVFQGREARFY